MTRSITATSQTQINSNTNTTPVNTHSSSRENSLSSIASSVVHKNTFITILSSFYQRIVEIFSKIKEKLKYCFKCCFRRPIPPPVSVTMPNPSITTLLQQTYWRLGNNKWKEGIDGRYHHFGREVFDRGLHKGAVEPGFLQSLFNAYAFVSDHLGERITSRFYLDLHGALCAHFDGERTGTLMGPEKVGVFRNHDDALSWTIRNPFSMENEAVQEFYALEADLCGRLNITSTQEALGWFSYEGAGNNWIRVPYNQLPPQGVTVAMNFRPVPRAEVERFFTLFINDFYEEIERAHDDRNAKLTACARLSQRLEWLHPTRDGSGRLDMAILNKVLTEYGFHPFISDYPWRNETWPLARWTTYLDECLTAWEHEPADPIS